MFLMPVGALQYISKESLALEFSVVYIFVFRHANGKPQLPICAKKDIYCLDMAEFIDRVCFLRGINKDKSKVKMMINYGKWFHKVSPKTTADYCNDFEMHQSSLSGSAFKFSCTKIMMLQAPEAHLNRFFENCTPRKFVHIAQCTWKTRPTAKYASATRPK